MCSFERYTLYFYLFEISYCCTIHQIQLGSKWVKLCAPKEEKEKKIILENNLFYSDRLMFYHWLNVLACIVYCIQWFNLSFFYSIKNYTTLFRLRAKNWNKKILSNSMQSIILYLFHFFSQPQTVFQVQWNFSAILVLLWHRFAKCLKIGIEKNCKNTTHWNVVGCIHFISVNIGKIIFATFLENEWLV